MRAVIMAGRAPRTLHPLTCGTPAPLLRICGRPLAEYALELLAREGARECVLCCADGLREVSAHFPAGSFAGLALRVGGEGLREAARGEGPVLVMDGGLLCDFPLGRMAGLLEKSGAPAVTAVREGRDAGIFLLSAGTAARLPADATPERLPELLEQLSPPAARWEAPGYLLEIRDPEGFRQAQRDVLEGRVRCTRRGAPDEAGNLLAGRRPAGRYELTPPVFLGAGVQIGNGAVIGAGSVLDDGCTVAAGATVSESVLLPRSMVGERAGVLSSVVGPGAAVKSRATLMEGVTMGADAVVGARAVVRGGVRITAGARAADGAVVSADLNERGQKAPAFDEDGLCGEIGVELTPELAVRVGCAIGSISGGRTVGVATGEAVGARVLGDALVAGIRSTGAPVLDFGGIFESLFSFAMNYNALELGVYLSAGESGAIRVVRGAGLPAGRRLEREIEAALARGQFTRRAREGFGGRVEMSGIGVIYLNELLRLAPDGLAGMSAQIASPNRSVRRLLESALQKLGCDTSDGMLLRVSGDGTALTLCEGPVELSSHRAVAAYCKALFEREQDVAVENGFPRALDGFAREHGRRVYRYLAGEEDGQIRRLAARQQPMRDGLMLAVLLLAHLRGSGMDLAALDRRTPVFAVEEANLPLGVPAERFLSRLHGERAGDGLLLRERGGVVLLRPRRRGDAVRVLAEAASWELAHELCVDVTRRLGGLLDNIPENG